MDIDWYYIMLQSHIGSWAFLLAFFVLTYIFRKKALHMILRVFYIIMIVSGGYMVFIEGGYPGSYHLKALVALAMVSVMEILLVRRTKKGLTHKQLLPLWIVVLALLTLLLLLAFKVISFG